LPRLARASSSPDLADAFESHLEETQGQVERIDQIVEILGIKLKRMKCADMEGLVEEGEEEKAADEKLTLLAEQVSNQKAAENA
jgi:ferritin-like metal-binding protein YciE